MGRGRPFARHETDQTATAPPAPSAPIAHAAETIPELRAQLRANREALRSGKLDPLTHKELRASILGDLRAARFEEDQRRLENVLGSVRVETPDEREARDAWRATRAADLAARQAAQREADRLQEQADRLRAQAVAPTSIAGAA